MSINCYVRELDSKWVAKSLQTGFTVDHSTQGGAIMQMRALPHNEPHSAEVADYIIYYLIKWGLLSGQVFEVRKCD